MSVNSVNFGSRPYGYNPKTGQFDPEQAKKDFRPGLFDSDNQKKQASRRVKVATGLLGLSAIAAGIFFRKDIGKAVTKGIEYAKPLVEKGIDFAKPLLEKGKNLVKTGYTYVVENGQKLIGKLIKLVYRQSS